MLFVVTEQPISVNGHETVQLLYLSVNNPALPVMREVSVKNFQNLNFNFSDDTGSDCTVHPSLAPNLNPV